MNYLNCWLNLWFWSVKRDWAVIHCISVQQTILLDEIISSRTGRSILFYIPDGFHAQWHHTLKHHQCPLHPERMWAFFQDMENLSISSCTSVVLLGKQTIKSFGWSKCFPTLDNMGLWGVNLSPKHRTQDGLNSNSEHSSLFMHYLVQKIISMDCVYLILRAVQLSQK